MGIPHIRTIQKIIEDDLRCEEHALTVGEHCGEVERMLEQIPGPFLEGEGDSPADAVGRLVAAYNDSEDDGQRRLDENVRLRELYVAVGVLIDANEGKNGVRTDIAWRNVRRAFAGATPSESDPGEAK